MALTSGQTDKVWTNFIADIFAASGSAVGFSKQDIKDAVAAADSWWTSNVASASTALSTNAPNFANNATANQKIALFIYMLVVRYGLNKFIQ